MLTTEQRTKVRDNAHMFADKVTFKHNNETVVFKRSYFYRNGLTCELFETAVRKSLSDAGLRVKEVQTEDRWAAWPRDSFFRSVVKLEQ